MKAFSILLPTLLLSNAAAFAQGKNNGLDAKEPSVAAGKASLIFSAKGLPPGVSIDAQTGEISGKISRMAHWKSGDMFKVLVSFQNNDGASGKTVIDIRPSNSPPVALDDIVTLHGKTKVSIRIPALENDHDPDGDPLRLISAHAIHGTVVTTDGGLIMYLPSQDSQAGDEILYEIDDGHGGSASARVVLNEIG